MKIIVSLLFAVSALLAQSEHNGAIDQTSTSVGRARPNVEALDKYAHPYVLVGKHPKAGCDNTAVCGEEFYRFEAHNLRTSAGTNWQAELMCKTSTPTVNAQCNYIALTNTAVTPAEADTTLSGEIVSNGLSRSQATYANASTTLAVPGVPTSAVVGTTGATTYYYWLLACNQGICTTVSTTPTPVTTANATLSTTNYVSNSWTPVSGAATYQLLRTTSSSAPSGTASVLVGGTAACTSTTCTQLDTSNTLTSIAVPASNLTNFGKVTLVFTWTATAAQSAQAFGVFTAASSGTMCFEGTFTPVSLNTNDTFQLTEQILF